MKVTRFDFKSSDAGDFADITVWFGNCAVSVDVYADDDSELIFSATLGDDATEEMGAAAINCAKAFLDRAVLM